MSFYKSALSATNTAEQTPVADGYVEFSSNNLLTGCAIRHVAGSTAVNLVMAGLYGVFFNADLTPTAAGDVSVQLVNNGTDVAGAEATVTAAVDETYHVSFSSVVRVLPSCPAVINTAALQVQVSAEATLSNANISVVKLA